MSTVKLKKKQYLGLGYVHKFQNNETGEIIFVPTTQEYYESMSGIGGSKNNPTLDGHTWLCSGGGTIKVDNPDTMLGDNEYVEIGEEVFAVIGDRHNKESHIKMEKTKISKDGNVNLELL